VEDADELAYVVLEWVVGASLLDMLSEGPLDPPSAALMVAEAARAIAGAHAAGLAHLRLDPACLHWTPGGGVKIAGLGIEAALAGPDPNSLTAGEDGADDPELTDTRDLARLLYAALTGYWPDLRGSAGSAPGLLPRAPENDGGPCTPRQVSAGVPAGIDDVTCRALFQRPNRHGPALSTAATFADALTSAAPPMPLPAPASTPPGPTATRGYDYQPDGPTNPYPPPGAAPRSRAGGGRKPPAERSTPARAVISVVIVLVLAAVGVAVWSVTRSPHHTATPPPTRPRSSAPAAAASGLLKPVSASSFNPIGHPPGSNEDSGETGNVLDSNASTFWHTSYYVGNPVFGGLKKGTGLLLDMGRTVRLSQVLVQFGTTCCAHVQIEIGNDSTPNASALSTFTVLQTSDAARDVTTFNVTSNATGRYVLIWLTYLPPLTGSSNQFQAQIYNVVVHGYAASQSG
jgi:hypothetical protein